MTTKLALVRLYFTFTATLSIAFIAEWMGSRIGNLEVASSKLVGL